MTFAAGVSDPGAIGAVFAAVRRVHGVTGVSALASDSDVLELRQMGVARVDPSLPAEVVAAWIRVLPGMAYAEVAAERGPA